ncbi:hypothetical protein BCR44DRAFT_263439 [Catenaria anguillulae PL171]|uniref:Uncharacterized protein n=1 Tax=Catenaria anguillulae PL171 TaxID=765915 RepID=A0A1Y2H6N7_9FUNG|nr:hypothetical protein BCR44DRAFT_263439 [Catenaria anguillulae PL171]
MQRLTSSCTRGTRPFFQRGINSERLVSPTSVKTLPLRGQEEHHTILLPTDAFRNGGSVLRPQFFAQPLATYDFLQRSAHQPLPNTTVSSRQLGWVSADTIAPSVPFTCQERTIWRNLTHAMVSSQRWARATLAVFQCTRTTRHPRSATPPL